jgi:excisionase family DNA binding protein
MDVECLFTVREVAQRLSVSSATIYALCEHGELAHVRVSNAIRIVPDELEAYVTRNHRRR